MKDLSTFHEMYRSPPLRDAAPPCATSSTGCCWLPPRRPFVRRRSLSAQCTRAARHVVRRLARTILFTAHSPIENSCKQTEARKGEARRKPRFQMQITLKTSGSAQNLNRRFMAMRSNKSKKKFAKRSSKSRESKITRKSTQKMQKKKNTRD